MGAFTPKYPIGDEEMLDLLSRYPFLKHRKEYGIGPAYETDAENIAHNFYKIWDGHGWEDLWKNRYLPRLFKMYDSWDEEKQKKFQFVDVKEKFGELRIYTSVDTGEDSLNEKACSLSSWICSDCGAEPRDEEGRRVIWTTGGWITNLCEDCAKKALAKGVRTDDEDTLEAMKNVKTKPFGYIRFSMDKNVRVLYKETDDGWLERDTVNVESKDIFKKQFPKDLTGEADD
jgi:DNA-directed RNA polymerase subunit RPC12/RpoP